MLTSCSDKPASPEIAPVPVTAKTPAGPSAPVELPPVKKGAFRNCTTGDFGVPPASSFEHRRSKVIARLGRVAHSAQDVIVRPGDDVVITGKFAYGRVSKDLENETVVVFLDTCDNYAAVGTTTTNDDGRTAFTLPSAYHPGIGVFHAMQVMRGDASTVASSVTIVPAGTHLVVFDVDGTLTIGDDELVDEMKNEYLEELYSGKRPPEAYPSAGALTKAWAAKGYLIVYMTGRPYWLAGLTRKWLKEQGTAPGHLHTTDRTRDARPTQGGVGEFKAKYLKKLIEQGYKIDYVYGNAESDIYAYAEAGIPTSRTYIIGEHGGEGETQAIRDGYGEHLNWVVEQPQAQQPFEN